MTTGFNPAWAVLMLIIVIAAIPLSIWLMRRLPNWRTAGNGSLEIRESMSLGPREKVLVLRCGDRHLLVGATGQSIQLLTELTDYPTAGGPRADFASQLKEAADGR